MPPSFGPPPHCEAWVAAIVPSAWQLRIEAWLEEPAIPPTVLPAVMSALTWQSAARSLFDWSEPAMPPTSAEPLIEPEKAHALIEEAVLVNPTIPPAEPSDEMAPLKDDASICDC